MFKQGCSNVLSSKVRFDNSSSDDGFSIYETFLSSKSGLKSSGMI